LIKRFLINFYILSIEHIFDKIYKIGEYYGLAMTSVKFWRFMNTGWEHCFFMRAKYKIYKDDD
jgi:hypothetical protein